MYMKNWMTQVDRMFCQCCLFTLTWMSTMRRPAPVTVTVGYLNANEHHARTHNLIIANYKICRAKSIYLLYKWLRRVTHPHMHRPKSRSLWCINNRALQFA